MSDQYFVREWDYRATMALKIKTASTLRATLAKNLQALMELKGLNPYDMARLCKEEVSRGAFQNMRTGKGHAQLNTVEVASRILELKQAWLLLIDQQDVELYDLVMVFNETSDEGRKHILRSLGFARDEAKRLKDARIDGNHSLNDRSRDDANPSVNRGGT